MTLIEVLDESAAFPLELPLTPGHHMGVPTAVLNKTSGINRWSLVAWNDDVSATIGLAREWSLLVLDRSALEGMAINFVRPGGSAGSVSLQAKLEDQRVPVILLKSQVFREEALAWLMDRKSRIEALFNIEISVLDGGTN